MIRHLRVNRAILLAVATVTLAIVAPGQDPASAGAAGITKTDTDGSFTGVVTESRQRLLAASQTYRQSLERLLVLQTQDAERARLQLDRSRKLLENGLIPRRQLETAELELSGAIARQADTARQIESLDSLVAEVHAAELAVADENQTGRPIAGPLVRYVGTSRWSMADFARVEAFYRLRFGRALPISALGQTVTHEQLGFDHREAVDVAVHPDTREGQELILYLQSQGISFIAIRQAISGSATGAHIHIGPPSRRAQPQK